MSKNYSLVRVSDNGVATYGVLLDCWGTPLCATLERPWRDNVRNVSCVPSGSYRVMRYPSKTYGAVYLFSDVPGRSGILIHPGNNVQDTEGCILVGDFSAHGTLDESRSTMLRLMSVLPYDFVLEIQYAN